MGIQPTNGNGNRALATQSQAAALQQVDQGATQMVTRQSIDPEVTAMAAAIWMQAQADGEGISKEQAVRAAFHFHTTGEVLGRHSYVATKGKTKGQVIEGYRAVERYVQQPFLETYRPLTPEECTANNIQPGDHALICEVTLLDDYKRTLEIQKLEKEMTGKVLTVYRPLIGICVYRKGEQINVPATKTLDWQLRKNAKKDALRKVAGVAATTDEIMERIRQKGLPEPEEGKRLSYEQALEWERLAQDELEHQNRTPEEIREAESQREERAQRREAERAAYDAAMDGAPQNPAQTATQQSPLDGDSVTIIHTDAAEDDEESYDSDAEFEAIPSATQEREAAKSELVKRAEAIRDRIRALVGTATVKESSSTAGKMTLVNMFAENRHEVLHFLFGHKDLDNMPPEQGAALIKWRAATKQTLDDGRVEWVPSQQAIDDAKVLAAAMQELAGQAPLFVDGAA